jgi:2'-5' RNA ligase
LPENFAVRVFYALWPGLDSRTRIAEAAGVLSLGNAARPVSAENYHLTLAFVGDVSPARLAVLQQIGGSQRAVGCTIKFDAYDYWPEPQVVVAVARQIPTALIELSARLHGGLMLYQEALNLRRPQPPRPPPLRAHVTLARKVVQAPVLKAMSPFDWSARSFSLVSSDTSGARSVYTVVDTWPLLYESPIA